MAVEQAILEQGIRTDSGTSARIAFIARVEALSSALGGRTVRMFHCEHARLIEVSWTSGPSDLTSEELEDAYPLLVDDQVEGALLIDGLSAGRSLDLDELIAPFLEHIAHALRASHPANEPRRIRELAPLRA